MRSPRPARWDIWYQFQAFPSVLRWMERYMYWTVSAIPGRDLPVLNFVNRPVCTNQFHLPKNSREGLKLDWKMEREFPFGTFRPQKKIRLQLPRMSYNNPATFQPDFPGLSNEIFRNLFVHHCKLPWPLFYCLGTPTWCTWRHVKRLYILVASSLCFKARLRAKPLIWNLMQIKLIYTTKLLHLASFWKWKFLELGKIVFLPGLALLAPLFSVNTSKLTASRVLPVPLEDAS